MATTFVVCLSKNTKSVFAYIREFPIKTKCVLSRVEGSPLSDCTGVWSLLTQDLTSSTDIVLSLQIFFVLIGIFHVLNPLLKEVVSRSSQEVFSRLYLRSQRRTVVMVLEL